MEKSFMSWNFNTEAITFRLEQYTYGGTAVEAWCEDGPYATISVNMPDAPLLPEGQFYLKNWSENAPIAQAMIAAGIIEAVNPPVIAHSGLITATAYQFTELGRQYCNTQSS
jgi:hypothetical protein